MPDSDYPNSDQLIVFARAPRSGRVKQRLARYIGESAALAFYKETLVALLERLNTGPWKLTVAVADAGDETHPVFESYQTVVHQGDNLGSRMMRELDRYTRCRRIIIGSDIPLIEANNIEDAFAVLHSLPLVVGPATDGGFWLVGCSGGYPAGSPGHREFMSNVRWSTEHALADTMTSLPEALQQRVARVKTLPDVDDGESYQAFLAERAATPGANDHLTGQDLSLIHI